MIIVNQNNTEKDELAFEFGRFLVTIISINAKFNLTSKLLKA